MNMENKHTVYERRSRKERSQDEPVASKEVDGGCSDRAYVSSIFCNPEYKYPHVMFIISTSS